MPAIIKFGVEVGKIFEEKGLGCKNMYTEELIIVMILGVLAYLVVIWANFADFVGILFKILPLKKYLEDMTK